MTSAVDRDNTDEHWKEDKWKGYVINSKINTTRGGKAKILQDVLLYHGYRQKR